VPGEDVPRMAGSQGGQDSVSHTCAMYTNATRSLVKMQVLLEQSGCA
jgi:hypothetical protein